MAEEYFVDFKLEDDITVDESDLRGHTNYESTELIISDIMTEEEIGLLNKSEESPMLELIPTTEAGEVEIAFVEESMIKMMTIDDGTKAAENSKRKKYQCENCGMAYVREDFYQKHISGKYLAEPCILLGLFCVFLGLASSSFHFIFNKPSSTASLLKSCSSPSKFGSSILAVMFRCSLKISLLLHSKSLVRFIPAAQV